MEIIVIQFNHIFLKDLLRFKKLKLFHFNTQFTIHINRNFCIALQQLFSDISTEKLINKHSTGISSEIRLTKNLGSSLRNRFPQNFSKIAAVALGQMINEEFFRNKNDKRLINK